MTDNLDEQQSYTDNNEQQQKVPEDPTQPKTPTSTTTTEPPSMADTDSAQAQETVTHETQNKPTTVSFSIWPPTQRTRDAVTSRLIESLSTPSILSKRYGTIPHDEASDIAKLIEEEAFTAAGSTAIGDDDGIEILQVYSKEISKRMLDAVKSRSAPSADDSAALTETESKPSSEPISDSAVTGENSSVETESWKCTEVMFS